MWALRILSPALPFNATHGLPCARIESLLPAGLEWNDVCLTQWAERCIPRVRWKDMEKGQDSSKDAIWLPWAESDEFGMVCAGSASATVEWGETATAQAQCASSNASLAAAGSLPDSWQQQQAFGTIWPSANSVPSSCPSFRVWLDPRAMAVSVSPSLAMPDAARDAWMLVQIQHQFAPFLVQASSVRALLRACTHSPRVLARDTLAALRTGSWRELVWCIPPGSESETVRVSVQTPQCMRAAHATFHIAGAEAGTVSVLEPERSPARAELAPLVALWLDLGVGAWNVSTWLGPLGQNGSSDFGSRTHQPMANLSAIQAACTLCEPAGWSKGGFVQSVHKALFPWLPPTAGCIDPSLSKASEMAIASAWALAWILHSVILGASDPATMSRTRAASQSLVLSLAICVSRLVAPSMLFNWTLAATVTLICTTLSSLAMMLSACPDRMRVWSPKRIGQIEHVLLLHGIVLFVMFWFAAC